MLWLTRRDEYVDTCHSELTFDKENKSVANMTLWSNLLTSEPPRVHSSDSGFLCHTFTQKLLTRDLLSVIE